jgi:hypothetical protein
MASHYLSIQRGTEGLKDSDFTYGTSSSSGDIEVRIDDTIPWTRLETKKALEAMVRFFEFPNPAISGTLFPVNN